MSTSWKILQWLVRIHLAWIICNIVHFLYSYLFDVFLGPAYNQSPPNVKYMTVSNNPLITPRVTHEDSQTNGGKYRFNPNLYAVCFASVPNSLFSTCHRRTAKSVCRYLGHGLVLAGYRENRHFYRYRNSLNLQWHIFDPHSYKGAYLNTIHDSMWRTILERARLVWEWRDTTVACMYVGVQNPSCS